MRNIPPLTPEQTDQLKQSLALLAKLLNLGIQGRPPLESAKQLAASYQKNPRYPSPRSQAQALARWEQRKNFTTGFFTSLGGLFSLPIAIPASMAANLLLQVRLSAAIAHLAGFDIDEPPVRTAIAVSLLGSKAKQLFNTDLKDLEGALRLQGSKLPKGLLVQINRRVAQSLVSLASQKGFTRLSKAVPLIGGVTGGLLDFFSAKDTAEFALELFQPK